MLEGPGNYLLILTLISLLSAHLGAAVGSRSYTEEYVAGKVVKWSEEIKKLAHIIQTQPHVAYCTFIHGLSSRWTLLL